jgi:ubiquinone/menaquinone biosynthesis C-methylase UbiE
VAKRTYAMCDEIIALDISSEMIKTSKKNLKDITNIK